MKSKRNILITGITGTLGKEMLQELLLTTEDRLFLLIRRKSQLSHWARVRKILAPLGLETLLGTRVQVVEGDICQPQFGLQAHDLHLLLHNVDHFFHVAALTSLNGTEEECRKINIGGTQEALKLAWLLKREGKLERFFYFSTAFVAGSRQTYCSSEDELPGHPAHANFYESSKYEAETAVRQAMKDGLNVTIFRPSIVVGDSRTGAVSEFNVIYPFLKLYAHGILTKLPTRLDNSFNIVPIDFVIRASLAISQQKESIGKAFHLVTKNPPAVGSLLEIGREEYRELPAIQILDPEGFDKESLDTNEQFVYQMLEPYLGYLNDNLTFDTKNTDEALKGTGIEFPSTDKKFLRTLLDYAVDSGYLALQKS
ncbi:MAG TPA: SDR family oxidoreductase [Verrucomicrobiae bacterium]|jgi:long-chain acyl-CoA synthetase|nr:SDR family oxidoreductase [Verrucomicrobiae bacterium]